MLMAVTFGGQLAEAGAVVRLIALQWPHSPSPYCFLSFVEDLVRLHLAFERLMVVRGPAIVACGAKSCLSASFGFSLLGETAVSYP